MSINGVEVIGNARLINPEHHKSNTTVKGIVDATKQFVSMTQGKNGNFYYEPHNPKALALSPAACHIKDSFVPPLEVEDMVIVYPPSREEYLVILDRNRLLNAEIRNRQP